MAVASAILVLLNGTASAQQFKAKIFNPPPAGPSGLATNGGGHSALLTEKCSYGNDYLSHCTVYKEDGSKYGEYCVDNNGKTIRCPK
jgi:hypothetical protein